jgi:hypothetical protein
VIRDMAHDERTAQQELNDKALKTGATADQDIP